MATIDVFLSYSRKDTAIMRQLRDALQSAGLSVWIDDEALQPGTPIWQQSIEDAIDQSRCMVVVLSPDAKQSMWVNSEITVAQDSKLRIFPVLIVGDARTAIPLALRTTQWVDARQGLREAANEKLLPALRLYLTATVPAEPTPAPTTQKSQARPSAEQPATVQPPPPRQEKPKVAAQPVPPPPSPIAFDWVTIPAGEYTVSKEALGGNAGKKVNLSEYRIAKRPVTNAQYKAFVDATERSAPLGWEGGRIPQGKEDQPVVYVSWEDANAFCEWASKERKEAVRLPTEVEWERAMLQLDTAGFVWEWTGTPYRTGYVAWTRRQRGLPGQARPRVLHRDPSVSG